MLCMLVCMCHVGTYVCMCLCHYLWFCKVGCHIIQIKHIIFMYIYTVYTQIKQMPQGSKQTGIWR